MADIITSLVTAFAAAWKVVEGLETAQSVKDQRHAARFKKRVAKSARKALADKGDVNARAAARLLGHPTFQAFASTPDDPDRQKALSDLAKTGNGLKGLIGPGADEAEVFTLLADAWVAGAVADATPVQQLIVAKQEATDDTLSALLALAIDAHQRYDAAEREHAEMLARLRVDPNDLVVGDPFLAQDVDLAAGFKMVSEITGGDVPAYVGRDVDPRLDALLAEATAGEGPRFVAVAGPTKVGKTRCLLEALARVIPSHVVYTVRRAIGQDTINALVKEFAIRPPESRWVVFVDDLYPHLAGGAALDAAVRRAETIDPPGLIVATTSAKTLTLTKADRLTAGINEIDLDLIKARQVELPRRATTAERARALAAFGGAWAWAGCQPAELAHFPERLAAIPELRDRLQQAVHDPEASHRFALMLAAVQLALARGTRIHDRADLRELAQCVHRHLDADERVLGQLTDTDLDDAERWATTRTGAAYALLIPVTGTDTYLEVLDDALDQIGRDAVNPRFETCAGPNDAAELGAAAFVLFADQTAALHWTRPAAAAGHTGAMYNLGVVLQQRGGERDLTEADNWYRKAAAAGDTGAMSNLGVLLKERSDLTEAENWWRKAAAAGHTSAMDNLALQLQERGGERDQTEAENWWRKAAAVGHTGAMSNLGVLLKERGDLTEAEEWTRPAAAVGHTGAMHNLGVVLQERGGERDLTEAESWYRKAAAAGHTGAMSNRGLLLQQRGDLSEAEDLWRKASAVGHTGAMYNLGVVLEERGDLAEAEDWYRKAADTGDPRVASAGRDALARIRGDESPLA